MNRLLPNRPSSPARRTSLSAILLAVILLMGCVSPQATGRDITVSITADGGSHNVTLAPGSTVTQALQMAGITVSQQDDVEPPLYTVLGNGDEVTVKRIQDVYETEEQIIAFPRLVVRNESLPEGQTRLVQEGENGREELTYRIVLQDGVEQNKVPFKRITLQDALPEIVMVGVQTSFAPLPVPGKLAYLSGGNAWLIDTSTANRIPLVMTGDLDGRVFKLSPNGDYLLYTRKSTKPASEEINTLWTVRTIADSTPASTGAGNVVHFADWKPDKNSIVYYSTVEPRATSPGWQANNDLYEYNISNKQKRKILDASSGGVYGWWGVNFAFSPAGTLAYAQPDGIGLIDIDGKYLKPQLEITPLNTHSDWAWLPSIAWGADGKTLYYTSHAPSKDLRDDEDSPFFDLSAKSLENNTSITVVEGTGMFAYPSVSSTQSTPRGNQYQVAYLQAIFPEQSRTSRYRLVVMDQDGSNHRTIFPIQGAPGLEPQTPVWATDTIDGQTGDFLAVVYQGNLWLVDSGSGEAYQVTGDGRVTNIDWK